MECHVEGSTRVVGCLEDRPEPDILRQQEILGSSGRPAPVAARDVSSTTAGFWRRAWGAAEPARVAACSPAWLMAAGDAEDRAVVVDVARSAADEHGSKLATGVPRFELDAGGRGAAAQELGGEAAAVRSGVRRDALGGRRGRGGGGLGR